MGETIAIISDNSPERVPQNNVPDDKEIKDQSYNTHGSFFLVLLSPFIVNIDYGDRDRYTNEAYNRNATDLRGFKAT